MNTTQEQNRRLTVILASTSGPVALARSLARFVEEVAGRGEVVVVDGSLALPLSIEADVGSTPCRIIAARANRLPPELWAIGIDATETPFFALTTTQMVPEAGWLDALLTEQERTGAACVGGPIEPGTGLGPFGRSMYLQRFVNYRRPIPAQFPIDPPGDNSLYRRDRLNGLEAAWKSGFWEVEIQSRLRDRGERLVMAPDAALRFQWYSGITPSLILRFRHAWRYGASRSDGLPVPSRLGRTLRAPLVPPLLLARTVRALLARREPLTRWFTALPGLILVLSAWALGEALGSLFGRASSTGTFRHSPRPNDRTRRGLTGSRSRTVAR